MRKGLWKKVILVLLPLLALIIIAYLDSNVENINNVLHAVSPFWLLLAVASMVVYYFCDVGMYLLACRYMKIPQSMGEGILTTMVGFFYSALTPFASGGQPMQVLQMRRRGIKVGTATSVLMLKFLAWQLVVTILGIMGFVLLSRDILSERISVLVMYVAGFVANAGTVALAALAFTKPRLIFKMGNGVLRFCEKTRILKREEKIARLRDGWRRTVDDYREAANFVICHRTGMLLIFLVAIAEAFAYMAVTYFIYRGLGLHDHGIFYVVLLQGLLYICVSFVPLPGASIASEGGFYLVFAKIFIGAARFPALVLWRLITYYSALLLGLIANIVDGLRPLANVEKTDA